jgi:glucose/mannose-6-phosphate isomerase
MPIDLNNRQALAALDPKGMWADAEAFPAQCRQALALCQDAQLPTLTNRPSFVALTGMGGSAACGDFVRSLFEAYGNVPFQVNRDYHLPNYVGLGDLVFCMSYSGNTEETLSAYADAKKAGAKIVAVTSGGKLSEQAKADGHTVITVPGGQPPRTALGYMLVPVLWVCEKLKLLPAQDYNGAFDLLEKCGKDWTIEGSDDQPKQVAKLLHDRIGILYGLGTWQGLIAGRWKSQINENCKCMAFSHAIPEMNHNEILGWTGAAQQGPFSVVALQDGTESDKMKTRLRVTREIIGKDVPYAEVTAKGETLLAKMLTLALFGDFASLYLSALNGVDPETIDSIDLLKNELAKSG